MSLVFNEISREGYYLNFNKDEIFKALIASEGHFRNFKEIKLDKVGFLNCVVKHLADAEGHCDEAISHALIAENEEKSRRFLELRDKIRDFRKWIQSSPITRDDGIREIRKIRRRFESFNPDYDVSKCETCGDPAEVMQEITKILNDLKKTPLPELKATRASESWIAKWEAELEKYKRLNIPLSRLKERIISHKASLILGREFGEDVESYLERRGLTDYYEWKDYEQWELDTQSTATRAQWHPTNPRQTSSS